MSQLSIFILSRKTLFNSTFFLYKFFILFGKNKLVGMSEKAKKGVCFCFFGYRCEEKKTELLKTKIVSYFLTPPPSY
jgi:hypothetical protein